MDLNKLQTKKHTVIHQHDDNGSLLVVKETDTFRWFEYGGQRIQSLMSKQSPSHILTPVSQAMLLCLLWKSKPLKVLNLGLGSGAFERSLATISSVLLTAVEISPCIIDMAKSYFNLPKKVHVICENAETYIANTQTQYDIILCDMFAEEKSPEFLFSHDFYAQLQKITLAQGVVMINLQAETDEQLLKALFEIKQHFPYIALIDFDDYKNIVVICSLDEIPQRDALQSQLNRVKPLNLTELESIIPKIRYIPHTHKT